MNRIALLSLILAVAGCPKGAFRDYLPRVSFERVSFDKPSWQGVDADFVLQVRNPNPIGVNLQAWSWAVELRDQPFLSGDAPDGAELAPRAARPFTIPVRFVFADLIRTAQASAGQGEIPYTFSGSLGVQTPIGVASVPFRHRGEIPPLRPPKVSLQTLRVERIDVVRGRAELALDLAIESQGGGAMGLDSFAYTLGLGGRDVVSGTLPSLGTVQSGESLPVSIPLGINVVDLGSAIVTTLQRRDPLQASLRADAAV